MSEKKKKFNYTLLILGLYYLTTVSFGFASKYLAQVNTVDYLVFKQMNWFQILMNSPFYITAKLSTYVLDYRIGFFLLFFLSVLIFTYTFKIANRYLTKLVRSYKEIVKIKMDKELELDERLDKMFDTLETNNITLTRMLGSLFSILLYFNMITFFLGLGTSAGIISYLGVSETNCYLFDLLGNKEIYPILFSILMIWLVLPIFINFIKFFVNSKKNFDSLYLNEFDYKKNRTIALYKFLVLIAGVMFLIVPSYFSVSFTVFILFSKIISLFEVKKKIKLEA